MAGLIDTIKYNKVLHIIPDLVFFEPRPVQRITVGSRIPVVGTVRFGQFEFDTTSRLILGR